MTEVNSVAVVAYDGWRMAKLHSPDNSPRGCDQGGGHDPQPVALLAPLGVDLHHEGRGLGAGLVQDVFPRVREGDVGRSRTNPLHLVLLMKDIRRTLIR